MPNLTTKELAALEDHISSEQELIKKYQAYAQMSSDPQIKNKCEQMASQHQNHYDRLMSQLN